MNLERHDPHAAPLVLVAHAEPMFVAVCPPHGEPGPWSMPAPFRQPTRAETEAEAIVTAARAGEQHDDEEETGGDELSGPNWQADARSRLAVAALRRAAEDLRNVRFDVELVAKAERRRAALSARVRSDDVWFVVDDEQRAVVSTRSFDVLESFTGLDLARELWPYVTVAVRADDFAAALYFDADEDRFYIAEPGDVVLHAAIEISRQAGCDVAVADDGIWVMSGLHEYFAKLKTWARDPRGSLPF